jgi:hypothetical protein
LAGSTTKKVLIRRFEREPLSGFVNPQTFLHPSGVELLSPGGAFARIPYDEIKVVCFVREFEADENEAERKIFASRPKMDGLWVRMHLRDGEVMDGILSNNLLALQPEGFMVTPPDANSNNQRLFFPRTALTLIQVIGVVGSPIKARKRAKAPVQDQPSLFE